MEKSGSIHHTSVLFDESGHFLLYPTMLGVKLINLHTNRLSRMIGRPENVRFLRLALFQVGGAVVGGGDEEPDELLCVLSGLTWVL